MLAEHVIVTNMPTLHWKENQEGSDDDELRINFSKTNKTKFFELSSVAQQVPNT